MRFADLRRSRANGSHQSSSAGKNAVSMRGTLSGLPVNRPEAWARSISPAARPDLPLNLGSPESCRRFPLSPSEGEGRGEGPTWGSGAQSASECRGLSPGFNLQQNRVLAYSEALGATFESVDSVRSV